MSFDHQVAGHKDLLFFYQGDESKLIKSCNNFEIKFYTDVQQLDLPLKPFLPFLHEIRDDRIVMNNLSYNFKKPNIIDIKLGTKLFDCFASEEKKNRMRNVAATTTSGSLGFRICGMKMHSGDYAIYDGNYGKALNDCTVFDAFTTFFGNSKREDLILIRNSLQELEAAYTNSKVVLIGASLLIIYEGSEMIGKCPSVNLIDFAHSTILKEATENEFDQERYGVLLGLKNILKIINSIIN